MEILWTQLANQDRQKIREYIAEHNLRAAIELDELIGMRAASLLDQPLKARNGRFAYPTYGPAQNCRPDKALAAIRRCSLNLTTLRGGFL